MSGCWLECIGGKGFPSSHLALEWGLLQKLQTSRGVWILLAIKKVICFDNVATWAVGAENVSTSWIPTIFFGIICLEGRFFA